MDGFSKDYGAGKTLGQSFLSAVVQLKLPSASSKFPLMRSALLCANLIAPAAKIVDGVPRLITRTDVQSLARRVVLLQVISGEEILAEAWSTLNACLATAQLAENQRNAIFGRLSSRVILFVLKKQNQGLEAFTFAGFAAIKQAFHAELAAYGIHQEGAVAPVATPASSSAASASKAPASLQEVSDPCWIAQQNGFVIGSFFTDKKAANAIVELVAFCDAGATFQKFDLSGVQPAPFTVAFADLASHFAEFKSKLPAKVKDGAHFTHMFSNHACVKFDQLRVSAYIAMTEAGKLHEAAEKKYLSFLINPFELRTKVIVPAGALKLFPMTELSRFFRASVTSTHVATSKAGQLYMEAPQRIKDTDAATWNAHVMFVGFWWVANTDKAELATMKLTTCKIGTWTFPMYENVKALPAWTKLVALSPPKAQSNKKARTGPIAVLT